MDLNERSPLPAEWAVGTATILMFVAACGFLYAAVNAVEPYDQAAINRGVGVFFVCSVSSMIVWIVAPKAEQNRRWSWWEKRRARREALRRARSLSEPMR